MTEDKAIKLSKDAVDEAFWLTDLYRDARALFSYTPESMDQIKNEAFVVLDANVLLAPYEMNSASMSAIDKIYGDLSKSNRLVVPAQAAREFYAHKSQKIATLTEKLQGTISRCNNPLMQDKLSIFDGDPTYIEVQSLLKEIANSSRKVATKLSDIKDKLKGYDGGDPVSICYQKYLSSAVVELKLSAQERLEHYKEHLRRKNLRIAPGFKDSHKNDGGIGDYIIWKTILQVANERKIPCIFVTNEEKSDWWLRVRTHWS